MSEKGKLVGKKLTHWKSREVEEDEEDGEEALENGVTDEIHISDDEDEEGSSTLAGVKETDISETCSVSHIQGSTAITEVVKTNSKSSSSGPLGLLGLVAYSSDSDLEGKVYAVMVHRMFSA